jgi:hypothetical protein
VGTWSNLKQGRVDRPLTASEQKQFIGSLKGHSPTRVDVQSLVHALNAYAPSFDVAVARAVIAARAAVASLSTNRDSMLSDEEVALAPKRLDRQQEALFEAIGQYAPELDEESVPLTLAKVNTLRSAVADDEEQRLSGILSAIPDPQVHRAPHGQELGVFLAEDHVERRVRAYASVVKKHGLEPTRDSAESLSRLLGLLFLPSEVVDAALAER